MSLIHSVVLLTLILSALLSVSDANGRGLLGANKPDLLLQYTGFASRGDGSPAYRFVTRAMAKKAISDAARMGFAFFRVDATGYDTGRGVLNHPSSLWLWVADPAKYWAAVDEMFDDLDASGLNVVPSFYWQLNEFPALAGDTVHDFIANPKSRSRALGTEYVKQFVERYRGRHTILFYEMGNELNLYADLDLHARCLKSTWPQRLAECPLEDHYDTSELVRFSRDFVQLMKNLDPTRPISSGFGMPRSDAYQRRLNPEYKTGQLQYAGDNSKQYMAQFKLLSEPFDVISIHPYPWNLTRFGSTEKDALDLIVDAAKKARKPLFFGEFGHQRQDQVSIPAPDLVKRVNALLAGSEVRYAAVWVWEFYQNNSYTPSIPSLEPDVSEWFFSSLNMNRKKDLDPTVILTWPVPCALVNNSTQVYAVATGSTPVRQVDFFANGVHLGRSEKRPFSVTLGDLTRLGGGPLLLRVTASDQNGQTVSSSYAVRVSKGQQCRIPEGTKQ